MKSFQLLLTFNGTHLDVDYCDGSDVEVRACPTEEKLTAEVCEAVRTALAPEYD